MCCYRFKDGVAYPWSAGVSNLILYPEAANQTLYTRRAARADSGNYTCRLSNETHSETHTVRLDILGDWCTYLTYTRKSTIQAFRKYRFDCSLTWQ